MKITGISTTTHVETDSASVEVLKKVLKILETLGYDTVFINANDLHIVENLSCYAGGAKNCASYDAGKYRCWAHFNSVEEPEKYDGVDEMPVIYDAINNSDIIIFSTSNRWMNHTALLQKIIERMNNLENRVSVYKEKSPLKGKRCGVIVTGQHYQSQQVAAKLLEVFSLMGFTSSLDEMFTWQKTWNMNKEQGNTSNNLFVEKYLETPAGENQIKDFIKKLLK
jgi:multimeric flavodoxin WrbA